MDANRDYPEVMHNNKEKTNKLLLGKSFCPGTFLERCIDILCEDAKGLFTQEAKAYIKDIYETMRNDIDKDDYPIYPIPGRFLNSKIDTKLITKDGNLYAGHDLPVWLNDPDKAIYKVLVLSQDPRRNNNEMKDMEIGISTPFGLHSAKWRSNRNRGMVHWLFKELIGEYGDKLSVYYTDLYKLRGVDVKDVSKSKLDSNNLEYYKCILKEEIKLFQPNVIFLMGKKAQQSFDTIFDTIKDDIDIDRVRPVPHPNARVYTKNGKRLWGKFTKDDFTVETKIGIYKEEIRKCL